jgi:hypothetical protein
MPVNVKNGRAVLRGVHHVGLPEFVVESLGHGGIARKARLIEKNSLRLCHSQGVKSRFGTGSRQWLQRRKGPLDRPD